MSHRTHIHRTHIHRAHIQYVVSYRVKTRSLLQEPKRPVLMNVEELTSIFIDQLVSPFHRSVGIPFLPAVNPGV